MGVLETATDDEIRKEYRNLAKKYHPDVCQEEDAQEKFLEIQQAYNMIKTAEIRRANYFIQKERQEENEKGEYFQGVDISTISGYKRAIFVKILENIRAGESVLDSPFKPSIIYQVCSVRNTFLEVLFDAESIIGRFPQFVSLACDDWNEDKNKTTFYVFSREEDQIALGVIKCDLESKKLEWLYDDNIIAEANLYSSDASSKKDNFMVKLNDKIIGTFGTENKYPFFEKNTIFVPDKNKPGIFGKAYRFLGTHYRWEIDSGKNKIATVAGTGQRETMVRNLYYFVSFILIFLFFFSLNFLGKYMILIFVLLMKILILSYIYFLFLILIQNLKLLVLYLH